MLSQTMSYAQSPSVQGRGGINPQQVGLGVSVAAIDTVFDGGALQPTGRDLDFAIENDGFFIVSEDSDGLLKRYTRDGAFFKDYLGNLVTAEGLRVLGYHPNDGGGNTVISTQNPDHINAATEINLRPLNIPSEIDAGFAEYIKYAGVYVEKIGEIDDVDGFSNIDRAMQSAEEIFDYANEVLKVAQVALQYSRSTTFRLEVETAREDLEQLLIDLRDAIDSGVVDDIKELAIITDPTNPDGTLQHIAQTLLQAIQDADDEPKERVSLETFSIDGSGLISAVYNDGQVYYLGRIGMAMFENPGGLEKLGGNTYRDSRNSGVPQFGNPSQDGFGVVRQGNLEMSNVDLANEFTEMIITSRAFQANSRTITTSDEMLQELINLKR